MRIEIASEDRVGITQEILSVFTRMGWDLLAMEVSQFHIFVHLKDQSITLEIITPELRKIEGVKTVNRIELMPGERKSRQLEVLLAKIPEPIIDIDKNGFIIVANKAAADIVGKPNKALIGKPIGNFIEQRLRIYLTGQATTQEVTFAGQHFFADISPLKSEKTINGAVIVLRSLANIGRHLSQLQQGIRSGFDSIVGKSPQLLDVINQAKRFANLDLPILINGETGTGKELMARALHDTSSRASKPFLAINCAALPEHLLESELFGYAPGAFTGAKHGGKPGLLELADGGSIFLDEIAEMPIYLQAKLLRFLQDFKLRRVGGVSETKLDVRIISATHQKLYDLIDKKIFREDLFYRLNVLNLSLPPLRERIEDLTLLVGLFVHNAAKQLNLPPIILTDAAMTKIRKYSWPGNIRELQNVLFKVVALADKNVIDAPHLQLNVDINASHVDYPNRSNALSDGHELTRNDDSTNAFNEHSILNWQQAQQEFEQQLLNQMYPLYPSTRKLAQRLKVSHNKIAMKLRQYKIAVG